MPPLIYTVNWADSEALAIFFTTCLAISRGHGFIYLAKVSAEVLQSSMLGIRTTQQARQQHLKLF
jgi:hypothetical protein